jgi:hypothetical protein
MNNLDRISEGKVFDSDPGDPESFLTLDPGSGMEKNSDPGSGINMPDSQLLLVGRIVVAMAMLAVVMIPCVVGGCGCKFTDVAALMKVVISTV